MTEWCMWIIASVWAVLMTLCVIQLINQWKEK